LLGIASVLVAAAAPTFASAGLGTALGSAQTWRRVYQLVFRRIPGSDLLSGSDYVAISGPTSGEVLLINRSTGGSVMTDQPG
jgi:hypothetical protein